MYSPEWGAGHKNAHKNALIARKCKAEMVVVKSFQPRKQSWVAVMQGSCQPAHGLSSLLVRVPPCGNAQVAWPLPQLLRSEAFGAGQILSIPP